MPLSQTENAKDSGHYRAERDADDGADESMSQQAGIRPPWPIGLLKTSLDGKA